MVISSVTRRSALLVLASKNKANELNETKADLNQLLPITIGRKSIV
jgi:hypothetical protein